MDIALSLGHNLVHDALVHITSIKVLLAYLCPYLETMLTFIHYIYFLKTSQLTSVFLKRIMY